MIETRHSEGDHASNMELGAWFFPSTGGITSLHTGAFRCVSLNAYLPLEALCCAKKERKNDGRPAIRYWSRRFWLGDAFSEMFQETRCTRSTHFILFKHNSGPLKFHWPTIHYFGSDRLLIIQKQVKTMVKWGHQLWHCKSLFTCVLSVLDHLGHGLVCNVGAFDLFS